MTRGDGSTTIAHSGDTGGGEPGYCFVMGCPRSGTTALTRLLHAHDAIVMGMERYKFLADGSGALGPELFTADRFLDFRPDDTNITPQTVRFGKHYELAAERLRRGGVRYVGDKVLAKHAIADEISAAFSTPRFVFIYRDLYRVASSFCARAMNPQDTNWPEWKTHENAWENWLEAFDVARRLLDRTPETVFVVRYERLFNGDTDACRALFRFLDLEPTEDVWNHFAAATANWADHASKELVLTPEQISYLDLRVGTAPVADFDARFDAQLANAVRNRR